MKVRVLSKNLFDSILERMRIDNSNVEEHVDKAFISINSSDTTSYFDKDYSNVLRVVFDDATPEENEHRLLNGLEPLDLCTVEIGEKIVDFIEAHKNVETFYVHCRAGQSRSGAVGTFINDFYGEQTFYEFCNSNPIIKPNYFILALLKRINYNR